MEKNLPRWDEMPETQLVEVEVTEVPETPWTGLSSDAVAEMGLPWDKVFNPSRRDGLPS